MSGAVTATIVALVLLGILALARYSRGRAASRVGSFACDLRDGGRWVSGVASYGAGRVDWHRLTSLSPRPARSWGRQDLQVVSHDPVGARWVVRCRYRGEDVELLMVAGAFAGLVSWLESVPPQGEPLE